VNKPASHGWERQHETRARIFRSQYAARLLSSCGPLPQPRIGAALYFVHGQPNVLYLSAASFETFHGGIAAMLKIALISDHASPLAAPGSVDSGGQNVYVAHVAMELAKLGYQVDVFTRRDSTSQKEVVRWRDRIRVVHVPAGPPQVISKEQILPYMPAFARFMIEFARKETAAYDLVHANFFMSGLVAQQIRQTLGIPFVITFHALGLIRRLSQGAADGFPAERIDIEKQLMQDAARVIAECPQDRLDMERHYGASRRNIDIVPCGFDPHELRPMRDEARQQLGLDPDEFIALQLGRMVPRKGVDNVIESLAVLRDRYAIRARLLVVGGDAPNGRLQDCPELSRLMTLSASLRLQSQVNFIGQKARDELSCYYSAANVFVTTPWYEPFGITPLEAMACATPVIGAAVGGIKTTVLEGSTGYLVPPKNPEALAERLALLHDDPEHARQLGEAGCRRAHQFYTWSSVAERLAAIYEKVADRTVTLASSTGLSTAMQATALAQNFNSLRET
jgi:D-inositol-3-phosphate glycosyltransferase